MMQEKPKLIYVYDALCGWCYGFSAVMHSLFEKYHHQFDFEVISGGMVLGDRQGPISESAELIKSHYPKVQETSGAIFGDAFLAVLNEGSQFQSSEKPAIALCVFKSFEPHKVVLFAHDIQIAKFIDGIDLNIDDNYLPLISNYNISEKEFLEKLKSEEYKQNAYYDFALARQLQVSGYPAAFIQTSERNFYMITKGYSDLATMELRVENVLKETAKA
ncbi:DsbA family protein [Pedobacter alpinus]|uniref:DsbA family protein n=1 Tax=Pedobacter alpinus TaxID=1590643 RepID=A0ABW5TW76_9SPHI